MNKQMAEEMHGSRDSELEHLVPMLGDIERNLAFNADAEERIAEHLRKYWAPGMRQRILALAASGGKGLSELSRGALRKLESA